MLALALPLLAALALVPSASATCNLIDGYVINQKAWYGPADNPPTLLWDIADDQSTPHDVLNENTGAYYAHHFTGPFAWIATPAWSQYTDGWNHIRLALFCNAATQASYVSVYYDDTAPSVAWSAPAANQWVRGTVSLEAGGGDTWSGIDHYAFSPAPATITTTSGSAAFDTTSVPDGSRTLGVTSVDRAGNQSATQTRTIRIDNTPPAVTLDTPIASTLVPGQLALAASANDAGSGVSQVRFELRASGGSWQALGSDSDAPFSLTAPAAVADGSYDVRAVATDALGNEAASPATAVVIDRTPPSAALDALPATVSGTVALSASASDALSGVARVSFQYAPAGSGSWTTIWAVDSAPWSARFATSQVADGAYDLRVVARDLAGNELASALRTVTIHNELQAVVGVQGPVGATGATGASGGGATGAVSANAGSRSVKTAVALRVAALPARSEGGRTVTVRGIARGIAKGAVEISLTSLRSTQLVQVVRTVTRADGSFSATFVPHFSGRVRVSFAGDAHHRVAVRDAGVLRVHPRIIVTITATHAADGSLTDPHVHGRLVPAGAPVRLAWQARPGTGGSWLLFCRSADQISVGRNGVIDGTCHVRGLHADNRYRLVLLGDSSSPYLGAVSAGTVARPTR
jgi:hypothetical protein